MNKNILIAGAATLGLLTAALPASAWFFGTQVEKTHQRSYAMLEDYPDFRVVDRSYERGLFSARERVTFEMFGDSMRAMLAARRNNPAAAAQLPIPSPVRFSVQSDIRHGPYLGSDGFGAAVIDSELVIEGEALNKLRAAAEGKSPIRSHTVVDLSGNGRAKLTSPAMQTELPGKTPAEPMLLTWGGLDLDMAFDRDLAHYTIAGVIPHLEVADAQGGYVSVKGMKIEGDQARLFAEEPMLFGGTMTIALASIKVQGSDPDAPAMELGDLVYRVDAPSQGDYIDLAAKIGADTVRFGDDSFGPAHYDFSLNHLHSRSLARLFRAWLGVAKNPAVFAATPGEAPPMAVFAPLVEPATEILRHGPEFRLDRLSVNSAQGEAKLTARATLKNATPDDFANPMLLLGKIDAAAELSLPEALLGDFIARLVAAEGDADASAQRVALVQQRIGALEQQGVLRREQGTIKSQLSYSQGQLTVNGQPIRPPATGG